MILKAIGQLNVVDSEGRLVRRPNGRYGMRTKFCSGSAYTGTVLQGSHPRNVGKRGVSLRSREDEESTRTEPDVSIHTIAGMFSIKDSFQALFARKRKSFILRHPLTRSLEGWDGEVWIVVAGLCLAHARAPSYVIVTIGMFLCNNHGNPAILKQSL